VPRNRTAAPRKAPTQERSRALVERIVDAGERVLVEHGYDGASTNRIAETAGVSPGSLYQYFPNKDAIVVAVVLRYREQLEGEIAGQLTAMLEDPPADVVPRILDALLDALARRPEILRAVVEYIPNHTGLTTFSAFEQRIADLMRGYLMVQRHLLRDADLDTAIWMVVRVVEQLSVRYVLEAPPIPREEFVNELATMVANYLGFPAFEQAARFMRDGRTGG
jgi:AcrR family transcriptional regulator